MPAPYCIKERDLPRKERGEIVPIRLAWAQALAEKISELHPCVATEDNKFMNRGICNTLDTHFPELPLHGFLRHTQVAHYTFQCEVVLSGHTPYRIYYQMRDVRVVPDDDEWQPRITVTQGSDVVFRKIYSEDYTYFPFDHGYYSYPHFEPLEHHVLVPILRDALKRGWLPRNEQTLTACGMYSDEMRHLHRTLQGLQRKYDQMLAETA